MLRMLVKRFVRENASKGLRVNSKVVRIRGRVVRGNEYHVGEIRGDRNEQIF